MVSDRIEALITHFCKGNKSLFAKQIGVTPSVIGNITGERKGNPSFEVAQKILDAFVTVNSDWFMLGRGSMLRSEQEQPAPQPMIQSTPPGDDSFIYNMYKDQLQEAKEEREKKEALIEEIGGLKERIRTLEERISTYQDKEPECPTAASLITEAFTSEPFGDSVKDSIHTRNPTISSKKLSGVKT